MADEHTTEDHLRKDVEDIVTLNESGSMISGPGSEDDLKDTVKLIARNLDKMNLKWDRFVARLEEALETDNGNDNDNDHYKTPHESTKLASDEKSITKLNATAAAAAAAAAPKTEEEIKTAFLSTPIGTIHIELNHELHKLRKELDSKTAENKMLHSIIQQAQTTPEISDEEVERRFRNLRSEIERFARTHFHQFNPHLLTVAHMRSSTQPLWVEASIADDLDAYMFKRPIFGHNSRYEEQLADFEKYLLHKDTPSSEVHLWVAETVKLTTRLGVEREKQRESRQPTTTSTSHAFADHVANKIIASLEDFIEFSEPATVYEDMRDLCRVGYDLAMILRRSRTRFVWVQSNPTMYRVDEELYDFFYGYDEVDGRGRVRPFRVRFGPVLKIGLESSVIVRKGELLSPGKR